MASLDNFWVAIGFFGFAIAMIVSLFLWNTIASDPDIDEDVWAASSIGANVKADAQEFYTGMDSWIVMIWVFLHLGILVTAFLLRTHPIIYIAGIFLIIILILVTYPLQGVWDEVYGDDTFITEKSQLTITNSIVTNMTKLEMVWAFVSLIILAGLARTEGFI